MHPPGNGLVERFNRTLGQGLRLLDRNDKADWRLHFPAFLLAYRMIKQKSTGHSRFEMLYGSNPRTPFVDKYRQQAGYFHGLSDKKDDQEILKMFCVIKRNWRTIHEKAHAHILKAQER
ncbi:hypothetical protein G6F42_025885 [Rhizopus arrhizus]|nr:hypothetical protein G6F42_025885 [Rhizopus arrhizus]